MSASDLRRRCEARLGMVRLPEPFTVEALCDQLGQQRGRSIRVTQAPMPAGLYGAWIAGNTVDYIFVEQQTSPIHQEHIVLHELGHLLCGHEPGPVLADQPMALLPSLKGEMVRRVLGRTSYTATQEREAELLASLISQRARRENPGQATPQASDVVRRLEETLGHPA